MARKLASLVTVLLVGCAPAASGPPATATAPAAPASASPPTAAPDAGPATALNDAAPPPHEDTAKEERARRRQADEDKWAADWKAELARWTPGMHAQVKAIADKTYPSGKAALEAAVHGPQRSPADVARDKYRHPVETLTFFGFKPTMAVLDVGPGAGWYTEILAPALAKSGLYVATTGDPNGPADDEGASNARHFRSLLESSPEAYGKVQTIVVDQAAPSLDKNAAFDLVLVMRGIHGMVNRGTLGTWLAQINRALKPGGVLGIEEHRAPADADPTTSSKKGYVPEKWLIGQVEAAGFKLAGQSEINANPKDTKDYPDGVWTLPPTLRLGDKDRDKYLAIGESDRMTLKFVKAPAAAHAAP